MTADMVQLSVEGNITPTKGSTSLSSSCNTDRIRAEVLCD